MEINWFSIFENICKKNCDVLKWKQCEEWFHAEIFSSLYAQKDKLKLEPFEIEMPYFSYYPVFITKNREWKTNGSVKWVDLCVISSDKKEFLWFELKVRNQSFHTKEDKEELAKELDLANRQARDAFKKDVVALAGFDKNKTHQVWKNPDVNTKAYYFERFVPYSEYLLSAKHKFVSAYLQLHTDTKPNQLFWAEDSLRKVINEWFKYRGNESSLKIGLPEIKIQSENIVDNKHFLIICSWLQTF